MRVCVTGSEGFIGSHFCDLLEAEGHETVRVDLANGVDLKDTDPSGCDWVAHFAANADVRAGWEHPLLDVWVNTYGTVKLLKNMAEAGCSRILFASSSAAIKPRSLYGASKASCEAFIEAYCHGLGFTGLVGRWVQVFGERYHHGHVVDFVGRLQENPDRLELLGDSRKTGIYVKDLCRALYDDMGRVEGFEVRHYSTNEVFTISESAGWIAKRMGLSPEIVVGGGGWRDDTLVLSDADVATLTVRESVERTVDWLCG